MTPAKPFCSEKCRSQQGWTEDSEGNITGRCPCRLGSVSPEIARAAALGDVAAAKSGQLEAACLIIKDAAKTMPVLSSNDVRAQMVAAQVDGPVVGAAFARCVKQGVIEPDSFIQSTDAGTHGHHVRMYVSKLYREAS